MNPLQMIMEYAPHSDLRRILDNASLTLSPLLKAKIALDAAKGLLQLHSKLIAHRDFRSPNIFIVSLAEDAEVNAKVADFGLAQAVNIGANEIQGKKVKPSVTHA